MPASREALAHPIHRAKLRRPRLGEGLVPRPRLTARFAQSLHVPLTLLSAPAGFGKTTLLAEWANSLSTPLAWLTVDVGDRELSRFVAHVIAAIEPMASGLDVGDAAFDVSQRPRPPPAADIGEFLADALLDLPHDVLLVVDDYHLAASVEVENFVSGLLQAMPPSFRLLLATRNDPALPLARMRLQGQIVEMRGEDLRFTDEEARALLAASGGSADDPTLAALQQTTGGWVAGLRLVALALPASDDPARIADAIAGDQHLMDFLVEEVLAKQPVDIQGFLLRTVIVDRVSAPLADALLDQAPEGGSRALLEALSRERFIFEPEGDDGVWFRHHPLFRGLLHHQLESRLPASALDDLHARASAWFAKQGLIDDAIRHCLAAGDATAAASLVELHAQSALNKEDWPTLANWLQLLPAAAVQESPILLLTRAWVSHFSGRLAPVRETLREVRALLDRDDCDTAFRAALLAECDALSLSQNLTHEQDPQAAVGKACDAVDRILPDHRFARGLAYFSCGCALQAAGETAEAVRWLTAVAEREAGRIDAGSIRALMGLVFVHRQAGNYFECREVASDMLALAERHGLPVGAGWARWALGWIAYEHNDLETAIAHFAAVARDRWRLHLSCVCEAMFGLALAYQASAMPLEANATLRQLNDTILDLHALAFLPSLRVFEARFALLRGNVLPTPESMSAIDVSVEGNTLVGFEHEVISRVKVLLAQGSADSLMTAWRDVERLQSAAEAGHHRARLVEILALAALICEARGQQEAALAYLTRSVELGALAGFCRTFVDLAPAIAPLLDRLAARAAPTRYLHRLVIAVNMAAPDNRRAMASTRAAPALHPFELLTIREAEVLDGLSRRLTYKEIAEELFISLHTVKSHMAHIYDKLEVTDRRQALAKAESLGWSTGGHITGRPS